MYISRKVKIGVVGFIITAFAILFIITQIDAQLFLDAWRTARYEYLLPTFFFLVLGLFARALRWQILLNRALPFMRAFSIMNVAYLVNGVLPLRMGEVARIYLATRITRPVPPLTTTSSIILERLLDLFAVVLMLFLSLSFGDVPQQLQQAGTVASIMSVFGFLTLIILVNRRQWLHQLLQLSQRYLPFLRRANVASWLDQFLDGLAPITHLPSLISVIFLTALGWILSVIAGYILMFAFFDDASLPATALYIVAAAFAIAVPAVPGNIGTYEASILLALSAFGYPMQGASIAFAVMVHAVNVLVHAVTGIIGLIQEGISLNQLSQGVQQMQHSTKLGQNI